MVSKRFSFVVVVVVVVVVVFVVVVVVVVVYICLGKLFALVVSSPEHKVVRVSYCDIPLSVVRPSVRACLCT